MGGGREVGGGQGGGGLGVQGGGGEGGGGRREEQADLTCCSPHCLRFGDICSVCEAGTYHWS